jgi:beta-fructofuranosidase
VTAVDAATSIRTTSTRPISKRKGAMTGLQSQQHADRSFPRLHPRPEAGWVNDPNGIMFVDGRWHVFFQYNPGSARHEDIHWGHTSSADLLAWEEHPVALHPRPGTTDGFGCWSGVGVIDDGLPAVVYSAARDRHGRSEVVVVHGSADARDWSGERVVAAALPSDERVTMVRDPFLFELGGRRWAIQGAGRSDVGGALLLYGADDLDAWTEEGYLLDAEAPVVSDLAPCEGWECPQLVRVGEDWVLIMSLWLDGQPHRGVAWALGSLTIDEGTGRPVFSARRTGLIDEGSSFYAPQAVQSDGSDGQPARVLLWGWAQELAPDGVRGRTQADADEHGWSGMLTFPRELIVRDDQVELVPARELTALRAEPVEVAALPDQAEVVLTGAGTAALVLGGSVEQTVWQGELATGDEVRVLIDASIVEIHRTGRPALTFRAYPSDGEHYALRHDAGVTAEAWSLRVPTPTA